VPILKTSKNNGLAAHTQFSVKKFDSGGKQRTATFVYSQFATATDWVWECFSTHDALFGQWQVASL
jgi:hypothetical protein